MLFVLLQVFEEYQKAKDTVEALSKKVNKKVGVSLQLIWCCCAAAAAADNTGALSSVVVCPSLKVRL